MVTPWPFPKGVGQLEAYIGAEEGVAFEMNNGEFWTEGRSCEFNITSEPEKTWTTKFHVIRLPSGKVKLRDWMGAFLAPVKVETVPETFPIKSVLGSEGPTLLFDVFFSGHTVAFRAYNGLFLCSVSRKSTVLEAAKFFTDFSCSFQPSIGDVTPPTFKILNVIPRDLSRVKCCRQYVNVEETYVNLSEKAVQHAFVMTWKTQSVDRIVWNNLWGLGVPSSYSFIVMQAKPIVRYTEYNERAVSVIRKISECQRIEVEVPPKTMATARLYVCKHQYAVVPFTAHIRKTKPNGYVETFYEGGAWMGLVYRDLEIGIRLQ